MSGNSKRAQRQARPPNTSNRCQPSMVSRTKKCRRRQPNIPHPRLESRITETYAARSTAQLKKSLQDLYKMSIRWATDRLGERGIIAFRNPNGYLDGNAEAGMRACLTDEFTTIHIFNLRGNATLKGKARQREKGNVFGSSTRLGAAITVMVRNPNKTQDDCLIAYRDIGDYHSTQEKSQMLIDLGSMKGIDDWQTITPDQHNDWINQRDTTWESLLPLGHKDTKANKPEAPNTVMQLYSGGVSTNRNPYIYSYDDVALSDFVEQMVGFYEKRRRAVQKGAMTLGKATTNDSLHLIKWSDTLKRKIRANIPSRFDEHLLRIVSYRPFVKQWLHFDTLYIDRPGRIPAMFPAGTTPNQAIAVSGRGSTRGFSALITDTTPDLELVAKSQVFARCTFARESKTTKQGLSGTESLISQSDVLDEQGRIDNITDWCLAQFQERYNDPTITKDDIWAYLYGVLHAPDWRNKYASELRKDLPRIPFAADFWAFREAGQQLINLHLGYETCQPWPLQVVTTGDPEAPDLYRIDRTMRWGKVRNTDGKLVPDKSVLHINNRCRIEGIPDEAHEYEVNGGTPLDWAIDRLKVTTDSKSGIVNDANQWHTWVVDPYELIRHLQRLVRVSVESTRIVNGLPKALAE